MKRALEEEVPGGIPDDMLYEIAPHVCFESVAEIFNFTLICKTAQRALPLTLHHWCGHLIRKMRYYGSSLRDGLRYTDRIKDVELKILSDYLFRHDANPTVLWKFLEAGDLSLEAATGVFALQKQALLDHHWLLSKETVTSHHIEQGGDICRRMKFSTKLKIRDVFYYDRKTTEVVPLKRLSGLRTVDTPRKASTLACQAKRIVRTRCTGNSVIDMLTLHGIENIKPHTALMRGTHYQLNRDAATPLVTHKPHKPSFVCNAIVDGVHLFSETVRSKSLRSRMYTCYYMRGRDKHGRKKDTKDYPECSKTYILQQYLTANSRFEALWAKLGIAVAGRERQKDVHFVYSTEEETSSSSSDDESDSESSIL